MNTPSFRHPLYTGLSIITLTLFVGCAATTTTPPAQTETVVEEPAEIPMEVVAPQETAPPTVQHLHYTVVRGDNLWDIAAKPSVYGNALMWPLIFKMNARQVRDADLIFPGQTLVIDENPSSSEVEDAIHHARNRGPWRLGPTETTDIDYLIRYGLR